MEYRKGKTVSGGIAVGRLKYFEKKKQRIEPKTVSDTDAEVRRYQDAAEKAAAQLRELAEKTKKVAGAKNAEIFEVHAMLLEDVGFVAAVEDVIRLRRADAEYAVWRTGEDMARMFEAMSDNPYMQVRAADMRDISSRLLTILKGDETGMQPLSEPVILLAMDLAPGETVQLDQNSLLGFVTRFGSANSHTAILAGTMGIPALAGVEIKPEWDGCMGILDGRDGSLYVDPDEETLARLQREKQEEQKFRQYLEGLKEKEDITLDGTNVRLYANIGNINDAEAALSFGARGIGLFRSEYLYLESDYFPDEETLFGVYRHVAELMGGKKAIIRTLDIGADKQVNYFRLGKEENPALGCRAIRICLQRPEILKTQLRAIYRAGLYGNLSVMFPMIISVDEVRAAKQIAQEVKEELRAEGAPFAEHMETGIMIETPAAALISGELAKEVDFFSIGTNDLTQYTLAVDRRNQELEPFYDVHHPAVLQLIAMTVSNAHAHGIRAGICGELGADLELTETFLRMGVDELSVSPSAVLPMRNKIRSLDLRDAG